MKCGECDLWAHKSVQGMNAGRSSVTFVTKTGVAHFTLHFGSLINPLSGKLCNSALKNLIFNTHDTLWIVNEKTTFLNWSCDLNFHTEL